MTVSARNRLEVLQSFYACFGLPSEGPIGDSREESFVSGVDIAPEEFLRLQVMIDDQQAVLDFKRCQEALGKVASFLSSDNLLKELGGNSLPVNPDQWRYMCAGVLWFSLAAQLDQRDAHGLPVLPEGLKSIDRRMPASLRIILSVQGSLVFRLYIGLVYARGGPINSILNSTAGSGAPAATAARDLMNCDFVRHLRNSLAHGTFTTTIAGIIFKDRNRVVTASPGFLAHLAMWVNLIQLQVFVHAEK